MQEFIFTLVIIYVFYRVFGRNVRVYHFNNFQAPQDKPSRPEGKISVDYIPSKEQKGKKREDSGDYVDYEEIK
jgi:hypothetical protein